MDKKPKYKKKISKKERKGKTVLVESKNQICHKMLNKNKEKTDSGSVQNNYNENKSPIDSKKIEKKLSGAMEEDKKKGETESKTMDNKAKTEKDQINIKIENIKKTEKYIPYSCIPGLEKNDSTYPLSISEE